MGKEVLIKALDHIPEQPGIYKMISQHKAILYIGKAKNLKKRVSQYTKDNLTPRILRMVSLVQSLEYVATKSEEEALLVEARLIKIHKPKYNILLKDDKTFPYIILREDHDFPQIAKLHSKKIPKDKYFGPFASSQHVYNTLDELQKIFKLRSCSDNYFKSRKRPCLQYQIRRCMAPCVGKVAFNKYRDTVQEVELFLAGKTDQLVKKLDKDMHEYSVKMEYEKAAELRDKIESLKYIQLKHGDVGLTDKKTDIIIVTKKHEQFTILVAFYHHKQFYGYKNYYPAAATDTTEIEVLNNFIDNFYSTQQKPNLILSNIDLENNIAGYKIQKPRIGEKAKLVKQYQDVANQHLGQYVKEQFKTEEIYKALQERFSLENSPRRIEIFDNSHIMGNYAIGGVVVASQDGMLKDQYRAYNILTKPSGKGGDDYAMLKEILTRRLTKMRDQNLAFPDFMIIDGGKGHLNVVKKLMKEIDIHIPFTCMSKGEKRNAGGENFHLVNEDSFTLDNRDPLMQYLQTLRDEAHNFAISKHRKKRDKIFKT